MTNDTIGIDISKDHLDAHRLSDGASRRFANDSRGHKAFMSWLSPSRLDPPGVRIVYEPTGPYHRAFERKLAAAGLRSDSTLSTVLQRASVGSPSPVPKARA
ncbi:hypothetical protein NKH71_28935 [Mesorhizobium sp. M0983]|uniref:hypothetical protein n=1 Tax=Mesorhizobium sp. M0983 TaxID=2957040 RepID=UPI003339ACD3